MLISFYFSIYLKWHFIYYLLVLFLLFLYPYNDVSFISLNFLHFPGEEEQEEGKEKEFQILERKERRKIFSEKVSKILAGIKSVSK